MPLKKHEYYIGIDTGDHTGYAVWHRPSRQLLTVESTKIHRALQWVLDLKAREFDLFLRVEDARLRKWIKPYGDIRRELGRREGAGSIKRDANIWEDFLIDFGIPFELVAPKDNFTKMSYDYFTRMTSWAKPADGHAIDAAMLVYGL